MKQKLSATQHRRLLKLLYMQYSPEEISCETEIPLAIIEQACASGCPHEVNEKGTWIVGTDFQTWLGISINSSKKKPNNRGLVNRENYQEVKAFLDYRIKVLQLDPKSIRNRWIELRHLLEWAGPKRLSDGPSIEPFFPTYLATARNDGKDKGLGSGMHQRVCLGGRLFFEWAKQEYPLCYNAIPSGWIKAIRPTKSILHSKIDQHEAWEMEDVLKIARLPVHSITEKRARAAICFLYLSGMRITAFLTLPLACVDIDTRQIEQNPGKGVITKNRKAAITTLLPIPELLKVVKDWDDQVRQKLPLDSPWFAYIDRFYNLIPPIKDFQERVNGRRMACIEGMKRLCTQANVPYKSPHKLRHAHAIFGIKHARDMRELKAVSQNLMHSSISITDGIYGNLNNNDIKETIAGLASNPEAPKDLQAILQLLIKLQSNPELLNQMLRSLQ
jgi:integrase